MSLSLIAQISDSHLGTEGSDAALAAAVDAVLALDPAPVAVLFTGDLTNEATAEQTRRAAELVERLPMPVHPIPGNHDDREEIRAAFAGHGGLASAGEFLDYVVDCGPARVVNVDTSVAGQAGGAIGPERIAWIGSQIERAEPPVILAMHHAPVGVGLHEFDEIGLALADRDALRALFEGGNRPELVVTGHLHRAVTSQVGGVPVFTCPSVHEQVKLDFRRRQKLEMGSDPAAIAVHAVGADPHLVSHVQPVATS